MRLRSQAVLASKILRTWKADCWHGRERSTTRSKSHRCDTAGHRRNELSRAGCAPTIICTQRRAASQGIAMNEVTAERVGNTDMAKVVYVLYLICLLYTS